LFTYIGIAEIERKKRMIKRVIQKILEKKAKPQLGIIIQK